MAAGTSADVVDCESSSWPAGGAALSADTHTHTTGNGHLSMRTVSAVWTVWLRS